MRINKFLSLKNLFSTTRRRKRKTMRHKKNKRRTMRRTMRGG
jgi:uncharacterized protein (DUF362 family)